MDKEIGRLNELKDQIREHDYNYYVLNQSLISDAQYEYATNMIKKHGLDFLRKEDSG